MSSEADNPGRLRLALRYLWSLLLLFLAAVIIIAAVLVGVGRALIPHVDLARPWLEVELSERIGEPVSIGGIEAEWPRLTPRITLSTVRVGHPDEPLLTIDEARLEAHLDHLVMPGHNLIGVIVLGLDLVVSEDEQGRWGLQVEGGGQLGMAQAPAPGAQAGLTGQLTIRDARVRVAPHALPEFTWQLAEADLQRWPDQTLMSGRLHPPGDEDSTMQLMVRARHQETSLDGLEAWFEVSGLAVRTDPLVEILPEEVIAADRQLDASLWLDWQQDSGARLDAVTRVTGGTRPPVSARLAAERRDGRIDVALTELAIGEDTAIDALLLARQKGIWAASAARVDLAALDEILSPWSALSPWWPASVGGRIEGLNARFEEGAGLHALKGRVTGLTLTADEPVFGIRGLDLELGLSGDRVVLEPSGTPELEWPQVLRQPLSLNGIEGRVLLSPSTIEFDGARISHPIVDARADGWIYLGGARPFMDFTVEAERVEAGDPRPWLPHGIIPDNALRWLDQALVHVDDARGDLLFHFRAGHRARDFRPGDFQARVEFSGAEMDYWPDWPLASLESGRVDFRGNGLFGRVDRSRLGEVELVVDPVLIPNLTEPELSMLVLAEQGDAGRLAQVLEQFPVEGWQAFMNATCWSGPLGLAVEVTLPFRRMADWQIDGEADLESVDVRLADTDLGLSAVAGNVLFDRGGIMPGVLEAEGAGRRVTLDFAAGFHPPASLQLGAELEPAELIAPDSELADLLYHMSGSAYWQLELEALEPEGLQLVLSSDLEGLALNFPPPLAKVREESWPLRLQWMRYADQSEAVFQLADRIDARLGGPSAEPAFALGVGMEQPPLPEPGKFDIRGQLDELDLQAWTEVFSALDRADGMTVTGTAALAVEQLRHGDLYVENVELDLAREETVWRIGLAGQGAAGSMTIPVPLDSGRVLAVDMSHLHLLDDGPEHEETPLELAGLADQTSTVDPLGRPPLHLLIEDLRYRDLDLGRVRIETHASRDGMEFEQVSIEGPALRLRGVGRWIRTPDGPVSEFDGRLTTGMLSEVLGELGFESGIEAASSRFDLSGRWPGAPSDFALRRFDGELGVEIEDGMIPEARPGAGRLLGLISLNAVPRRLMLDFRDVFAQGLSFDSMQGRFRLSEGVAVTDELRIDSPAALIRLSGSADMVERQYDQLMVVEPGVGSTLPVLGVLAGGPVGAAAGLVLQTLFDRPLRGITEARYSVTGSWNSPVIELVEARVADEEGQQEVIVPETSGPDPD